MSRKKFAEMSTEERAALASGVADLRESKGMTQEDLAKASGVSRQSISSLERGATTPSGRNLAAIMRALGVEEAPEFDMQTEKWLVMIGTLVEKIPSSRRQKAMTSTQQFLMLSVAADIDDFALAAQTKQPDAALEEEAAGDVGA